MLTEIATLDAVLRTHAAVLGRDFTGYRNHTYRVANFCAAHAAPDAESLEKIGIAAAFHDLGIWTGGTFDYLQPSIALATDHLSRAGRSAWAPEITAMILEHHKITRYRPNPHWLVEAFRRADWADVSLGLLTIGLPRHLVREAYAIWPSAGFHQRLVQLSLARLRAHPATPLPMLRL